jgi:CRP-like cAMP-binding protein
MPDPQISKYKNELLRRLSPDDLASLEPSMDRTPLLAHMVLELSNSPIEHVYFIEEGIASVVAKISKGRDTEVGLIGTEGMTGVLLVLGDDRSVHETYVQLEGSAIRVPASTLVAALSESVTLKSFLLRYVQSLYIQTGYTALVNARSKLDERLARWLLMYHDRVSGDRFAITHEFVSIMLGVRRPGVTVAIQELEGRGLIKATRGEIVIRDRSGLVLLANGTYSEPESEYERLIGKISRH